MDVELLVVRADALALNKEELMLLDAVARHWRGEGRSSGGCVADGEVVPDAESAASALVKLYLLQRWDKCELQRNKYGKPFIPEQPCEWNMSHSDGLVCVALASAPVGIDVETIGSLTEVRLAALRRAAPLEVIRWVMEGCDDFERAHRFAQAWTAAEAALKAMGIGFSQDRVSLEELLLWQYGFWEIDRQMVACACVEPPQATIHQLFREDFSSCLEALGGALC